MTETERRRLLGAQTPGVDRRAFVKLGLGGAGTALAAACGWDGGGAIRPLLLDWSRVNDWVGEKVLFSPTHLARTYSAAERSAMLPSYFISGMMPMLRDPDRWRLRVQGLVEHPLELSLDDLMRLPRTAYTVKHHCVEGWSAIASWHGVPVSAIVARCRPRDRNTTNPPNASPPAERIGLARPIRCSRSRTADSSSAPESAAKRRSAAVSAASAGPTCSRGSVLPTT